MAYKEYETNPILWDARGARGAFMANESQYPDHFIERLHRVWGAGFLFRGAY